MHFARQTATGIVAASTHARRLAPRQVEPEPETKHHRSTSINSSDTQQLALLRSDEALAASQTAGALFRGITLTSDLAVLYY